MRHRSLIAATAIIFAATSAAAQTYRTPSQNSPVDQLHSTPSMIDPDGNLNTDPAMTPSTKTGATTQKHAEKGTGCQVGSASATNPDNTDNPSNLAACAQ